MQLKVGSLANAWRRNHDRSSVASSVLWALLLCQGAVLPATGCTQESFRCGVRLEGKTDEVTRCSRNLEVCVCETNLCARQVAVAECPSGLRYVEEPFVADDRAGQCVTGLLRPDWLVRSDPESSTLPLCRGEAVPDTGADMADAGPGEGGMSIDQGGAEGGHGG